MVRATVILALVGATVGTLLDGIHSHSGQTYYAHPTVWLAPWWVPLLFGSAFTLGMLRPLLERAFRINTRTPSWGDVASAFAMFVAAYALTGTGLRWWLVAPVLVGMFAWSWTQYDRSRTGLAIALLTMAGGPLVEAELTRAGLFYYTHPVMLGLAGWLPFLYPVGAVAMTLLAKKLCAR